MASLGSSQRRGRLAGHLLLGSVLVTTVWVAPAFGHPGVHSAWSGPVAPLAVSPDSAVSGEWSAPFSEGGLFDVKPPQTVAESKLKPTAVSAAVLPDGRILYWGGLEGLEDGNFPAPLEFGRTLKKSRSRILDLGGPKPEWSIPAPEDGGSDDMFCAVQRLLYDGRVIVVGGSIPANDPVDLTGVPGGPAGTSELYGSKATHIQRGIAWEEAVPTGFRITTPDASKIQKVVLVRLPSTTHVTDADMRAVELSFTKESSSVLHATSPPNGKVAPPGWYYLFLLQDNGGGLTPSCARIVRVGAAIDASAAPALCRVGSFLGSSQPRLAATGRGPLASPLLGIFLLATAALIMRMLAAPKRAY